MLNAHFWLPHGDRSKQLIALSDESHDWLVGPLDRFLNLGEENRQYRSYSLS